MTEPKKKNLSWLWYFTLLLVLGILGALITGYFNFQQQMKLEDIQEARKRWDRAGVKTYSMRYLQKRRAEPDEVFEVTVRQGEVTRVLRNDVPMPTEPLKTFTMGEKLREIEQFYSHDTAAKKRVYVRGYFDAKTGRLHSYIRRVMGSDERLSITVQEFQAE